LRVEPVGVAHTFHVLVAESRSATRNRGHRTDPVRVDRAAGLDLRLCARRSASEACAFR
jgi:hypothetical protein